MNSKNSYDVIIVGGGLSGLTMACVLGAAGVSVACLDRDTPEVQSKDERTTAISSGSRAILEKASIWQHLKGQTCAIETIEILDGGSPVLLDFDYKEVGDNPFGWIVDNADLRRAMHTVIGGLNSIDHIAPAAAADFAVEEQHASVILDDEQTLNAQLIIGADGRGSGLREWMDVPTRGWSYKQRAIVCIAEHENPHNHNAVEHFYPEGPFATLPMYDDPKTGAHRSSVVFTEHGREAESWMAMSDADFELALNVRFPDQYGAIKLVSKRQAYPLSLVHAAEYVRPRMALIADAAHGIHPIAGQGLNLGFRDIECLGTLLAEASKAKEDLGSEALLTNYQRKRRPDNMAMVAATDGLNRLFANDIAPVRALRRAGMKLVGRLPPAKRMLMRYAMGQGGLR